MSVSCCLNGIKDFHDREMLLGLPTIAAIWWPMTSGRTGFFNRLSSSMSAAAIGFCRWVMGCW